MADVILEITIPDARVDQAISLIEDTIGHWEIKSHDNSYASKQFEVPEKGEMNNKQWGEYVARLLLKSLFQAADYGKDKVERYDIEVAAVDPPEDDVPEDILQ